MAIEALTLEDKREANERELELGDKSLAEKR